MEKLKIALAQIAPVWLNREKTIEKVSEYILKASQQNCDLVTFGESFIPGYPFWISQTDGARFNSKIQKEFHAHYLKEAVQIETGHLDSICQLAKQNQIAIYLGVMERPEDRGGHNIYCSLVYINKKGKIKSCHRKLMPTYEERLSWAQGDGNGLRTHKMGAFTLGGLNCWENWMPLPRATLYAQGEDLHVAVWPGGSHNTHDITRFIAKEARSFVVSTSGLLRKSDIPKDTLHYDFLMESFPKDIISNGGSAVASPTGEWLLEPQVGMEDLFVVEVDHQIVREERQNFDPSGHYSRPDVTTLTVNRERQSVLKLED
ncbi:MAG: nitrilase [Arenicella sp.]|jgi:nitrilase